MEQTLQVYAKALSDADNAVRISEKELILLQAENERSRQHFVQAQNYLEKHPKDGDLEFLQLELTPLLQELSEIRTKLPPAEKAAAEKTAVAARKHDVRTDAKGKKKPASMI